jgi:hypothetical protein
VQNIVKDFKENKIHFLNAKKDADAILAKIESIRTSNGNERVPALREELTTIYDGKCWCI